MRIAQRSTVGGVQRPPSGAAAAARTATQAETSRAAADGASVLGIPTAELTPAVREGIAKLMAEVDRLRQEIKDRDQRIRRLEKLADEDPLLTPTLNRRAFVRELSRMMAFAERYDTSSSILYFDVNGMKRLNDTYGHGAGDAALTHVANTLLDRVRGSDVVGRLGGDEFGVLLAQADEEVAAQKGTELAAAISDTPFEWSGHRLSVTASYGAFSFDGDSDPNDVLRQADTAMYVRKRARTA